jgi:hypothetical protein
METQMKVVLVEHGEVRDIVAKRDPSGKVVDLFPKTEIQGYIDLSFNDSKPVRVLMSLDQYEQAILPQMQ